MVAQKIVLESEDQLRWLAWVCVLRVERLALTHSYPKALRQRLCGRTVRVVIGNQKQRSSVSHPRINRLALGRRERGVRRLGKSRTALRIGDHEDLMRRQYLLRERFPVHDHAIAVIGDETDKWLVQALRPVEVEMRFVKQNRRMLRDISWTRYPRIVIGIDHLRLSENGCFGNAPYRGDERKNDDAQHAYKPQKEPRRELDPQHSRSLVRLRDFRTKILPRSAPKTPVEILRQSTPVPL